MGFGTAVGLCLAGSLAPTSALACEGDTDRDGDGVCDVDDGCPDLYDPYQGPLGPEQIIDAPPGGSDGPVATTDLDGDGDLDVVLVAFPSVRWWPNLGGGRFGAVQEIAFATWGGPALLARDTDADGDPDLVYANGLGLAWQENQGAGAFAAPQPLSVDLFRLYTALDLVDVDGDGDEDVLTAYLSAVDAVSWFENLGGSFGDEQILSTAQDDPMSVAAGDYDGDGDLDLAVGSFADSTLATYENLGGGSFGPPTPLQIGTQEAPAAVDVDGDGDLDLIDGQVGWHENFGNAFGPLVVLDPAEPGSAFLPADLDGDGRVDLIEPRHDCWYTACSEDLYWRPNLGGGSFGAASFLAYVPRASAGLAVGDLDGDGRADLVSAGGDGTYNESLVQWWASGLPLPADTDGDGTCDASDGCAGEDDALDSDQDGLPNGCDACLPLTDSDGDGVPDACDHCPAHPDTSDADADGAPDGCDPCPQDDPDDTDGDGRCDSDDLCAGLDAAGDEDQDGTCADLDPCTGDDATSDTDLDGVCDDRDLCPDGADTIDRDGDGLFDACDPCPDSDRGDTDGDAVCDDVDVCEGWDDRVDPDGDQVPDGCDDCALAYDPYQGSLFVPEVLLDDPSGTFDLDPADLDADGDTDLVAATFGGARVWVNDGQGGFSTFSVSTDAVQAVRSIDVDRDGDLDIAAADWGTERIVWHENLGTGFGPAQEVRSGSAGFTTDRLFAADLDGDGDADLLSALDDHSDDLEQGVTWFESFGDGTFAPPRLLSAPDSRGAISATAADLDGDGDLDVLASTTDQDVVVWYPNLGGQTFGPGRGVATALTSTNGVAAIAADLDGDGDADVVASSETTRLAWYPNDGAGGFAEPVILAEDVSWVTRLAASDLDGDGDLDLVHGAAEGHEVAWWENLGGAFGPRTLVTHPDRPATYLGLAVADLDGDGDPDVAVGTDGYPIDHMRWFPNQRPMLPDCDGDGLCDAMEPDGDADGIPDACDADPVETASAAGQAECGCDGSPSGAPLGLAPLWFAVLGCVRSARRRRQKVDPVAGSSSCSTGKGAG
ncbi:MAG: FG-GAP-like repeat-containing protein [Myxococcota bacterium]